jgi:hypothetical protein
VATVKVPKSLAVSEFHAFVGARVERDFHQTTHTLLYFLEGSKDRFDFTGKTVGECFPHSGDLPRLSVFVFQGVDEMCIAQSLRIQVVQNETGYMTEHLFAPTTTIGHILTTANRWGIAVEQLRVVALRAGIYDGIYRNSLRISHREVRNPLVIDVTPEDQWTLSPNDKLIAVCYIDRTEDPEKVVGSGYLRVAPGERFGTTRERLREGFRGEVETTKFTLSFRDTKRTGKRVLEDMELWAMMDDFYILKVVVKNRASRW